jgi:putative salt-induced outer membrane protein YdiY
MGFTTTSGVEFISSLESFVNVVDPEDTRLNTEASIVAALSEMFALKLSYKLNYDAQPVEGFARADQTGLVTVVTTVF